MMRNRNPRHVSFGFRERGVRKHSRTVKCPFIAGNGNESFFFGNKSRGSLARDTALLIDGDGYLVDGSSPYGSLTEDPYGGGCRINGSLTEDPYGGGCRINGSLTEDPYGGGCRI